MRAQYRGHNATAANAAPPLAAAQRDGLPPQQEPPLPAPQPTRASVAPMAAQPPQPPAPQLPGAGGAWTPDMGIRFGGSAAQSAPGSNVHNPAYPNTRLGGQWTPSRGPKFG